MQYNPELIDKQRILAISKCDMLDEQMMKEMKKELPKNIDTLFISSHTHLNIDKLIDLIWKRLNE